MRTSLLAGLLGLSAIPAVASPVVSKASINVALARTPLIGVNLSGCEFMDNGALCPSTKTVNAYIDQGFKVLRIPFKGVQAADAATVSKIKAAADAAVARGIYVILDRHDYGSSFNEEQSRWWQEFIKNFPSSTYVMIDTMNEPKSGASYEPDPKSGRSYATEVNAGIAAFRKAGFKHKLLIEWRGWSGMSRFNKNEAANAPCISPACSFDRAGGLQDPLGLTMVSGHRYPDADGSGTSATCVSGKRGESFISNTERAAAARGLKVWIGEFAFGNATTLDATCAAIGKAIITHVEETPGVYAGISVWGGGSAWKERYIYRVEPTGGFSTSPRSRYLNLITK